MNRTAFGVDALLTRIVPGALVLMFLLTTPLAASIPSILNTIINSRSGFLFAVAIAYVLGEILNLIRELVYTTPYPFKEILYFETEIEQYQPKRTKYRQLGREIRSRLSLGIKDRLPLSGENADEKRSFFEGFANDLENRLNLRYELLDPDQVYYFLLSYIGTNLSRETERKRLLLNGVLNSLLAQGVVLFFSGYSLILFLLDQAGGTAEGALFGFVLILAILGGGLPVGFSILRTVEEQYMRRLLVDYYVSTGFQRDEIPNSKKSEKLK